MSTVKFTKKSDLAAKIIFQHIALVFCAEEDKNAPQPVENKIPTGCASNAGAVFLAFSCSFQQAELQQGGGQKEKG